MQLKTQDTGSVTIQHAVLQNTNINVDLQGFVLFENCTFEWTTFSVGSFKNYNFGLAEKTFKSFFSSPSNRSITVTKCILRKKISFDVSYVAMQILFIHCVFLDVRMDIHVGQMRLPSVSALALHIEKSTIVRSRLQVFIQGETCAAKTKFSNCLLNTSNIYVGQLGIITFEIENCTFLNTEKGLHLSGVWLVKIRNCDFAMKDNATCEDQYTGCLVSVLGFTQNYISASRLYKIVKMLVFPTCTSSSLKYCLTVQIENSVFVGSSGSKGGVVRCEGLNVFVLNCELKLTESGKPSSEGAFIFKGPEHRITARKMTLAASRNPTCVLSLSMLHILAVNINIENGMVQCPESLSVVEVFKEEKIDKPHQQHQFYVHHKYSCEYQCLWNEYTFETGLMNLHGESSALNAISEPQSWGPLSSLADMKVHPNCLLCPMGANCEHQIQALPNYWGYKDQTGVVDMIRCPDDYCCQNNETCKDIYSCNEHRNGFLCGMCKPGWDESLFSPKCLPSEGCSVSLVMFLYVTCVVAYGVGLILLNWIKDEGPSLFKRITNIVKRRFQKQERKQQSSQSEPSETKQNEFMKYVQILFFYVQDATLFKVHLPQQGEQNESFVIKLFQFSPEVLTTLFTDISNLCIGLGTSSVTKILLSSLFGTCVIVFISLFYLGHECLSFCAQKSSKKLRAWLVQSFLLVILFSYQKQVLGAFSLVHCVSIGNRIVLYVQGEIECYTWWQNVVQCYIVSTIVPLFAFLSYCPLHVENRAMSVKMFIIGCLFPVPVMLIFHLKRIFKNVAARKVAEEELELEDENDSTSEHTVISEQQNIQTIKSCVAWNLKVDNFFLAVPRYEDSTSSVSAVEDDVDSDTDIGSEYSTDLIRVAGAKSQHLGSKDDRDSTEGEQGSECDQKEVQSNFDQIGSETKGNKEAITDTLMKHYRPLSVFDFQFVWLGIHQMYRVGLVACNVHISDPMTRLCSLSALLLRMSIANTLCKPYKHRAANKVSLFSYAANILIAMINLLKVTLVTFGCEINCSMFLNTLLLGLDKLEDVFLVYTPLVVVPLVLLFTALKKCWSKMKKKE